MVYKIVLVLFIGYVVLAFLWVRSQRKIVMVNRGVGDVIDPGSIISMPREITIRIVEDSEVDWQVYSDLTVKMSDLISGNYKVPKQFLKGQRDVIAVEDDDEPIIGKDQVEFSLYDNNDDESSEEPK